MRISGNECDLWISKTHHDRIFLLGILFVGFSFWALYLTDIPQEQLLEDPRFEEEYVQYYQRDILFGSRLIGIGWIFVLLGRKMSRR